MHVTFHTTSNVFKRMFAQLRYNTISISRTYTVCLRHLVNIAINFDIMVQKDRISTYYIHRKTDYKVMKLRGLMLHEI